jgi:hypothetical protein
VVAVVEVVLEELLDVDLLEDVLPLRLGLFLRDLLRGGLLLRDLFQEGFSITSCSSTSASSRVVRGSSLIACCRDGVRMSLCESRVLRPSFCWMANGLRTLFRPVRFELYLSRAPAAARPAGRLRRGRPCDLLVGGELFGCAGTEDFAFPENIGPIRDFQGLAHVVIGDEDADARGPGGGR